MFITLRSSPTVVDLAFELKEVDSRISAIQPGTPLIPALGRQRQTSLSEFKASLGYRKSFRTAKDTQRKQKANKQRTSALWVAAL